MYNLDEKKTKLLISTRIYHLFKSVVYLKEKKMSDYDDLVITRNNYVDKQYDQCKTFDQSIFLISSGIFGVSFSFLQNLVKTPIDEIKWIIILAWSLILLSIIVSLLAYIINYYAYKTMINIIDDTIKNMESSAKMIKPTYGSQKCVEVLNIVNLATLVSGMLFLMVYIGISYTGG